MFRRNAGILTKTVKKKINCWEKKEISSRRFRQTGQLAFYDKIYSDASNWYQNVKTKNYCEINGKGKKSYNERINIGHGTFTPLVILANGGMSRGCQTFYTKLPEKIPEKACQSNSVFSSCIVDSVKKILWWSQFAFAYVKL